MELSKEEQEAIHNIKILRQGIEILNCIPGVEKDEVDIKSIDIILNLINKQSKVIDEMAKEIENMTGSCPLDRFDFNDIDCENKCNTGIEAECWKQYFYRKVENENENND